jgi:hypothetical protein
MTWMLGEGGGGGGLVAKATIIDELGNSVMPQGRMMSCFDFRSWTRTLKMVVFV